MNLNFLKIEHDGVTFYLCKMKCADLLHISYVARRGVDEEEGAVQRILNKRRISSISNFIQEGGYFPTNFILNVLDANSAQVDEDNSVITLPDETHIAQVLDGQHRIAGLKDAIKKGERLNEIEYPVMLAIGLNTQQCAKIFLSINTEQKQVPRSLIYDLYGVTDVPQHDVSINRGNDIAQILNEDEESPYHNYIKFPGSLRFVGGIQLYSLVTTLKPLVKPQGEFEKYQLTSLEIQAKILINYFSAYQYYYGKKWNQPTSNPFLYAMGFGAAIEILINKLLPRCFALKKFSRSTFIELLPFTADTLPDKKEFTGKSGEMQKQSIYEKIESIIPEENVEEGGIEL